MKRNDYIIIILLVIIWGIEDLYLIFPTNYKLDPFLFADKSTVLQRFIYDIIIYVKFAIFVVCIMIRPKKVHFVIKNMLWLTIGLTAFSLTWFVLMYGNPYYQIELWLKFLTVGIIFGSIKSIQWHAKYNNSIFSRGIRRDV